MFFSFFFYGVCILYKTISLVPYDELPFCSSCRGPSAQRDTDEQNDILWPAMACYGLLWPCYWAHKAKERLCWHEPKALNYYPFGEDGPRVRCSFRETGCLSFICIVRFQFFLTDDYGPANVIFIASLLASGSRKTRGQTKYIEYKANG